ncbi:hypothetical protein [Desulfurobacterium sp.]
MIIKELKAGKNKDVPLKIYFDFRGEDVGRYWTGNISAELPGAKPVEAHVGHSSKHGWYIKAYFPIDGLLKLPKIPNEYEKILKKEKAKGYKCKEVAFLITEDEAKEIRQIVEKKIEETEKKAEEYFSKRDVAYIGIGGDTHQLYVADFDAPKEFRETKAYGKWQEHWEKILKRIDRLYEIAEKTDITTPLYNVLFSDSNCWGRVSLNHPAVKRTVEEYEKELEEKKRKREEAERKREERELEAIEEAKRTGKPVYFEVVGYIDGDDYNQVKMFCPEFLDDFGELGLITIWKVAYPDGTIREKAVPSY